MQITFDLPHVFQQDSPPVENAEALRASLDYLIALNRAYLRTHPDTPTLYRSGVRYGRTQVWDSIPALYMRRYGDCKSLACALIAERRAQGLKASPVFRFIPKANGGPDFHILVQTPNGFEDPSKVLGMGQNENAYFRADSKL